jgi:RES domain-containing protein
MAILWRIGTDTADYGADDLTGKGAEITGGRWNRKGTPVVYTSSTIAMACLETLVHLGGGDPLPLNRFLVQIEVPDSLWQARTRFNAAAHVGWDAEPAGLVSLDWGTAWLQGLTALLADVPSIVVPEESNLLLNPRHPGAAQVIARKVRRWTYDARLA